MAQVRRPAKRFAPLDPQKGNDSAAPQLNGIVFDVDGTLWCVSIQVFSIDIFDLFLYLESFPAPTDLEFYVLKTPA